MPAPTPPGNPTAHLTVEGEVRTVDSSDQPRLCGRGRPGVDVYPRVVVLDYCLSPTVAGVHFGLSSTPVDWSSAADGCPAGTWVCRRDEIGNCNTTRPDGTEDGWLCSGAALDFNSVLAPLQLPVWCCW